MSKDTASRRIYRKQSESGKDNFTTDVFEALAEDLRTKRTPLDRITITDGRSTGLRAIIRNTGNISYHAQYSLPNGSRPYIKLGEWPGMKPDKARSLARVVQSIADKGIDVQAGLHERLIRELLEKGDKWKP